MKSPPVLLTAFLIYSCNQNKADPGAGVKIVPVRMPHLEKQGTATRLIVEGKPFLLIAGELHNSTTGSIEYLRPVWKILSAKNLNSVIATVSWELAEPVEGKLDSAKIKWR